jgi:ribonuclease HI
MREPGTDIQNYYEIWCDGSCHHTDPENAWMGCGVYHVELNTSNPVPIIRQMAISAPKGDHNQSEYLAIICALTDLYIIEGARRSVGAYVTETKHVTIHSDSQLIIRQITGVYQTNKEIMRFLKKEALAVQNLLTNLGIIIHYKWNPRDTKNQKKADWLSKCGNIYYNDIRPDETCAHGVINISELLLPGTHNSIRERLKWPTKDGLRED